MDVPLRILIVEGHPGAAAVAAHIMVRAGHQVTVAESGAVALQLCHAECQHFDAVILEADLPVMGGIETARRLKEHEVTANIPIVGLSALQTIPDADVNVWKGGISKELLEALVTAQKLSRKRSSYPCKHVEDVVFRRHDIHETQVIDWISDEH